MLNENRASFTIIVKVNSSGTGMCINVVNVKLSTVTTRMISIIDLIPCRLNWLNSCVHSGAIVVAESIHVVSTMFVTA